MAAMSDYLEEKLLNHTFRNVSFTPPTTVYLALYTSNPTDADTGTEVSGGAYARQAATFSAATNPGGQVSNDALITFPTATAGWGTVTHFAIRDALTAGNMLVFGALTNPKTVDVDDQVKVNISNLTVTFA